MKALRPASRESGMSLIELMVGMLIGLIGIIMITHLYLTNEEYKRSTTGAGSAQVNGAVGLYTMERDVRMAGFGFNNSAALGCSCVGVNCSPVQYFHDGVYSSPPGPAGGALPPLAFVPVNITQGVNAPDSITLLFGNALERSLPGTLSETMPHSSAEYKVDGTAGFNVNDMVLVTQGSTCMLTQITQIQTSASHLQHNPGSSEWNPAGGGSLLPAFSQGASLFNLGNPTWRLYAIANNRLTVTEVLTVPTGGGPLEIVDDIVDLQAQYGWDTSGNGIVESAEWRDDPPASPEWTQAIAIRIAVLARSPNYVRPAPGTTDCDATTAANAPAWAGGTFPAKDFVTATSQDRCYRYRVFETTIPLRNMIWRPA